MSLTPSSHPVAVTVAGEALIDLVMQPDGRLTPCAGGASYNLTRALARQGVGVAYLNPLSRDRFGRDMCQALMHEGVVIAHPEPAPEPTSLAVVHLDDQGHPAYAFYRQGVADRALTAQSLIASSEDLPQAQVVCVGCLALAPEDADLYLPWMADQHQSGRLMVLDVNMRPSVVPDMAPYRANVMKATRFAHIIKASDEDLEYLDAPGQTAHDQARWLLEASGAQMVLLTLGAEGAALVFSQTLNQQTVRGREQKPIEVADTIGAGDSFLAGFLSCWMALAHEQGVHAAQVAHRLNALDASRLLRRALATASINVMRTGCNPPTASEVQSRLAQSPAEIY
jgi:fructokinase